MMAATAFGASLQPVATVRRRPLLPIASTVATIFGQAVLGALIATQTVDPALGALICYQLADVWASGDLRPMRSTLHTQERPELMDSNMAKTGKLYPELDPEDAMLVESLRV